MSYEQLICSYCQEPVRLGEDHEEHRTPGGIYYHHITCSIDDYPSDYEKRELQKEYYAEQRMEDGLC